MLGDPGLLIEVFSTLAIAAVLSVALIWRFLGTRRSELRRCPVCWHDLSATPGMTCGECGFRARDEEELHRSRRRPGVAIACVALVVILVAVVRFTASGPNWTAAVPGQVLVALLPWSDGQDQIAFEISKRVMTGQFDAATEQALLDRCVRGDQSASPGSPEWERRYGPILAARFRLPGSTSGRQAAALWKIPCRVLVEGPSPWPAGHPTAVHVELTNWWPSGAESRVTVRPRDGSGREVVAIRTPESRAGRLPVPVDALPPGTSVLEVEVEVERRPSRPTDFWGQALPGDEEADWEPAGSAVVAIAVDERGPIERLLVSTGGDSRPGAADANGEPMPALEQDAMHEAMGQVFQGTFVRWASGTHRFGVMFNPGVTFSELFRDVAIGLRVEVLHKGVPRRVSNLWWMGGPLGVGNGGTYAWEILREDREALDVAVEGDPDWTLRVTGDPLLAARATAFRSSRIDGNAGSSREVDAGEPPLRWFSGSLEVPLMLRHRDEMATRRSWEVQTGSPAPDPARPGSSPAE